MRPKIAQRLNSPNVKVVNYRDCKCEMIYDEVSDEFFNDTGELENYYDNNNPDLPYPQYVYGTYFKPVKLDLDYMLGSTYEDCTDNYIEDFIEDSLNGVEELRKAVNKFNESNKEIGCYYEDFKTIVKLNWEE